MLSRIFPKQIDNDYRGSKIAIWILVLFLLVMTLISVNAIGLNPLRSGRSILQGVERVPLDTFRTNAADVAIVLFAWWGGTTLMLTVLGFIAVLRYRSMVPLIYLLTVINHIGGRVLADTSPIVGMLGKGSSRPLVVIAVLLIGFGLSLTKARSLEVGA